MIILLMASCVKSENLKNENLSLNKRIHTLKDSLNTYKNLYNFSKIKPVLIPTETDYSRKEEKKFTLIMAADGMFIGDSAIDLAINIPMDIKNQVILEKEKGIYTLRYKLGGSALDTISVNFEYIDPNSNVSISLPANYVIE